jgi:hypothetical protein
VVLDGLTVADPFRGNIAPAGAIAGLILMEVALALVHRNVIGDPAFTLVEEDDSAIAGASTPLV